MMVEGECLARERGVGSCHQLMMAAEDQGQPDCSAARPHGPGCCFAVDRLADRADNLGARRGRGRGSWRIPLTAQQPRCAIPLLLVWSLAGRKAAPPAEHSHLSPLL